MFTLQFYYIRKKSLLQYFSTEKQIKTMYKRIIQECKNLFYSIKDLNFKSFFLKDYKKSAIENSSDFYVNLKKYYLNKYKKILEIFKKNNNG